MIVTTSINFAYIVFCSAIKMLNWIDNKYMEIYVIHGWKLHCNYLNCLGIVVSKFDVCLFVKMDSTITLYQVNSRNNNLDFEYKIKLFCISQNGQHTNNYIYFNSRTFFNSSVYVFLKKEVILLFFLLFQLTIPSSKKRRFLEYFSRVPIGTH